MAAVREIRSAGPRQGYGEPGEALRASSLDSSRRDTPACGNRGTETVNAPPGRRSLTPP